MYSIHIHVHIHMSHSISATMYNTSTSAGKLKDKHFHQFFILLQPYYTKQCTYPNMKLRYDSIQKSIISCSMLVDTCTYLWACKSDIYSTSWKFSNRHFEPKRVQMLYSPMPKTWCTFACARVCVCVCVHLCVRSYCVRLRIHSCTCVGLHTHCLLCLPSRNLWLQLPARIVAVWVCICMHAHTVTTPTS